jgi:hypothetical protein
VTWAEVIRKLKAAGFVHTKKDAGRLGNRILREAGIA